MAVQLPVQRPVASGWGLADFRTIQQRTAAAGGGSAQLELAQVPSDELWFIDHAVVACTSSTSTSLRLYAGSVSDLALLDGSLSGNFDVADWPNGLLLEATRSLIARWDGASDGAIGTLTLQLRVMRRA